MDLNSIWFWLIAVLIAGYAILDGFDFGVGVLSLFGRNEKERRKLAKNLDGIRGMSRLPDAVFIVDTKKEQIAVDEARKLKIPVIGVVDTNCDPDEVDFVIPGNDDALRAIRLFASKIAEAVTAGRGMRESRIAEEDASRAEEAAQADAAARLRTAVRPQRREAAPTPAGA